MNQLERIGDKQEGIRQAILGLLWSTWTALPGIVQSVNYAQCTCTVRPAIKSLVRLPDGTQVWKQLPILQDVPIIFPSCRFGALTLPLALGDEVLVIFSDRCIDAWWQQGNVQIQSELRLHDLSDGFAIPGPFSVPNVLANISQDTIQMRSADGTTYVEIAAGGVINIVAPNGLNVNGAVVATGEVTAISGPDAITLSQHVHGEVTAGGDESGPPIG